ncbi:MAG: hypothetical protein IPG94_18550 [Kineosporiaceae bacterium]|nr:hypothetical protein [Kineosporiaceae bacterium]
MQTRVSEGTNQKRPIILRLDLRWNVFDPTQVQRALVRSGPRLLAHDLATSSLSFSGPLLGHQVREALNKGFCYMIPHVIGDTATSQAKRFFIDRSVDLSSGKQTTATLNDPTNSGEATGFKAC